MAWQRDLCLLLVEGPRSDSDTLRITMQEHTESRTAFGTEGTRSGLGCLSLCGTDMPSDIVSRKECPGLIGCAGLFAAGCAVAVYQAGWGSGGRVADVITSAAAGSHSRYLDVGNCRIAKVIAILTSCGVSKLYIYQMGMDVSLYN